MNLRIAGAKVSCYFQPKCHILQFLNQSNSKAPNIRFPFWRCKIDFVMTSFCVCLIYIKVYILIIEHGRYWNFRLYLRFFLVISFYFFANVYSQISVTVLSLRSCYLRSLKHKNPPGECDGGHRAEQVHLSAYRRMLMGFNEGTASGKMRGKSQISSFIKEES